MDFPEQPRIVYERNPLTEVVCQIRFPRILTLEERVPADFQLALGSDYPLVDTREVVTAAIVMGQQPQSAAPPRVLYDFSTRDARYKVTICSEFIAVTTHEYERWDAFLPHIVKALTALNEVYSPPVFTRVGLRYQDVIDRKKLDLEGVAWPELIRRSTLGLLAEEAVPDGDVIGTQTVTVLKLAKGSLACRYGLIQANEGQDVAFMIDSDFFFEDQVSGSQDALDLLRQFNLSAGRAFRWFIQDRLHDALGPRAIPTGGTQ